MKSAVPSPQEQILSLIVGFWQGRALAVAVDLKLPDILAEGPLDVDELATRSNVNSPALFRLLRALATIGIFTQISAGVFANTEASETLRKDLPGTQRPLVLHNLLKGNGPFEGWGELASSVRTGEPPIEGIYGYGFWELLRRSPQANAAMNETARSFSSVITPAVTAAYDWSQFSVIADIGGGVGTQLVSILDASPFSRGVLLDQPHLSSESIPHERMEVVGGDFFESVPSGADAYLMRWILHDWAEAEAASILETLRRAMKPTSRLILVEFIISDGEASSFGKWADLQMLVTVGGRERTEAEYRTLLSSAGFDLEEVVTTASPMSLLVARPR